MKIYGCIYKITNKINGKSYIGQTTKDFDIRYHNNILKYTHNRHLKFAMKRYGVGNFEIDKCIDVAFNQSELDDKEKYYIQIYNSYLNGYNLTLGGEGIKGTKNPMYGVPPKERMSQEVYKAWLEKIDENHKGGKNPNSSKVICLETKEVFECIKDALRIYGNIGISANCRGKCKSAGKLKDGTKLHWMYYNEYLKKVS